MNEVTLHRDDLETILQFMKKYPTADFTTISVDSSSGIGSIVKASVFAVVNGDPVTITKTIVDESSW
jgi:hypothetical protein